MITCPKCKSTSKHRMKRRKRIKLIPKSETYACDHCNVTYTYISLIDKTFAIG